MEFLIYKPRESLFNISCDGSFLWGWGFDWAHWQRDNLASYCSFRGPKSDLRKMFPSRMTRHQLPFLGSVQRCLAAARPGGRCPVTISNPWLLTSVLILLWNCYRRCHRHIGFPLTIWYADYQTRVSVSAQCLQTISKWKAVRVVIGIDRDRSLRAHRPRYTCVRTVTYFHGIGSEQKKKGSLMTSFHRLFPSCGAMPSRKQRKGANMESGCWTSAAHIVAFGEPMGLPRSPLELCLWQQ